MDHSMFNDELLNFRFLPADIDQIDDSMVEDYEKIAIKKDHNVTSTMYDLLTGGIRFNPNREESKFICVICNEKLNTNPEMFFHVENAHLYPEELLRKTLQKPVVGMDSIIEYRNEEDNKIAEYECKLCSIKINEKHIFWHVISLPHKEKFYVNKFPNDIRENDDENTKHEKIDKTLIEYENSKNGERGKFQRKLFMKGMIDGNTPRNPLNMQYIRKFYPQEEGRLKTLFLGRFPIYGRCKNWINLKINTEEEFIKGKEILQEMNRALLEYRNL